MRNFLAIIILLCSYIAYPQLQGSYKTGEKKFRIDTLKGMYNGKVTLWGNNGKKKLEGQYKNNQRTGKWTVWDSLGQVRLKIDYTDSYRFSLVEMNNSAGKPIKRRGRKEYLQQRYLDSLERVKWKMAYNRSKRHDTIKPYTDRTVPQKGIGFEDYIFQRDSNGVLKYPAVFDTDVLMSRKLHSYIEPSKTNQYLFDAGRLPKAIAGFLKSSSEVYTTSDFTIKMPAKEALEKFEGASIAGYKTVDIYYFDKRSFNSGVRIIAIVPVTLNKQTQRYEELFSIYYPAFREYLSKIKFDVKDNPEIRSLEDAIHFRRFSSFIYFQEHVTLKESDIDIYNDMIRLKKESAEMEGMLLNYDWGSWLYMTE